jgi:hypothetical protein
LPYIFLSYGLEIISPEVQEVIGFEENTNIFSMGVSSWGIPAIWGSTTHTQKFYSLHGSVVVVSLRLRVSPCWGMPYTLSRPVKVKSIATEVGPLGSRILNFRIPLPFVDRARLSPENKSILRGLNVKTQIQYF